MNKLVGHFSTITAHKIKVGQLCFRCGLYKQGLLHDLSKYSWVEFSAGVKYFKATGHRLKRKKKRLAIHWAGCIIKDAISIIGNIGLIWGRMACRVPRCRLTMLWKCFVIG